MRSWLEENGELTLAIATEGLLINKKRLLGRDSPSAALEASLLTLLQEGRIRSLKFPHGFTDEEFLTFLNALASKFWELPDGKLINQRLREEGVHKITVDEVEYLEVGKDDILLKDGAAKAEAAGLTPEELINQLEVKLEVAAEGGKSAEMRFRLFKRLLEQDPSLLVQLQAQQAGSGLLRDAVGSMTFDKALGVVAQIKAALAKAPAESAAALRQTSDALLATFQIHRTLAPSMKAELEKTAPELVPPWMSDSSIDPSAEPAAVERTKVILTLPPALRMEALEREGQILLRELVTVGRVDLAEKVLGQLLEMLSEPSAGRRRLATDSLFALGATLESEALTKVREDLENKIRELLDQERDPRVYSRLTELAASLADTRLRKGEVNQALRLLDILKRHSTIKDAAFPERSHLVLPALDRVTAGEGYKAVAGAVGQKDDAAVRLQQAIDKAAIQFLVGQMKEIEQLGERLKVGESITKVGDSAAAILCEELEKTTIPTEALRLVETVPTLVPAGLAEDTLVKLISGHPVLSVRRRSATLLAEKGFPRAVDLLKFAFANEKVPAYRAMLAEALGRLGEPGIDTLTAAAQNREEADEVRIASCAALARTCDARALPILVEIASRSNKGFTRIFKVTSPAVRAAAVKALAVFPGDENIKAILSTFELDPEPLVKAAAHLALHPEAAPAAAKRPAPPPPGQTKTDPDAGKLAGMLDSMPVDQLLQMLATSGKTGLLRINAHGQEGNVFFEAGKVTSVTYQGQEGQPAFTALLATKQGAFVFRVNERAKDPKPPVPIQQMLLEAAWAADEQKRTG
jgi:hypothetical protein